MDTATIVLSLFMAGSTIADVETTLPHYYEYNPVMRPLKDSRLGLYTVKGSVNIGVGVLSHKLRHSGRKRDRIIGWVLPVLSIATQSLAARHNARR